MRFSSPHHRHALPSSPACQISSFISGGQIYFVMLFRVLKVCFWAWLLLVSTFSWFCFWYWGSPVVLLSVAGRWRRRRRWGVLLGALLAVAGSVVWVVRFFTHCFSCFCWWRVVLLVGGGGDDGRGLG
jgi:hypothetical protein